MKQKFDDLKTLVKGSRKAKLALGLGGLAVLFLLFGPEAAPRRPMRAPPKPKEDTALSANKEAAQDILTRFGQDLDHLRKANEGTRQELGETRQTVKDYEKRTAEILKKMLERMSDSEQQTPTNSVLPAAEMQDDPYAAGADGELAGEEEKMESIWNEEAEVAPPPVPPVKKVAFVGAGDSVRIKLLAGVNAPTDGTPYPVVFSLSGDVAGPDGSTLPLGEARLIAAAQGSLTDSRALFRLTSLNIQLPNGERKVYEVDGWVVGEDGIRGMSGVLIDPIGKALAGSMIAGAVNGVGQGISQSNQTVTANAQGGFTTVLSGDIGEFAAGRAIAGGANTYQSIIKQRLNSLVPVVQVLSGREATAVFAKNLTIEGLIEAMDSENEGYATLD